MEERKVFSSDEIIKEDQFERRKSLNESPAA